MWHYCLILQICFGATVHPRIRELRANQSVLDALNSEFTINPHSLREYTPVGNFTLKSSLHNGMYSSVYTVRESRDIVIKYQCNCDQTTETHRLLTDAWFSDFAHDLGISPKILFVSPPVPIYPRPTRKLAFTMSARRWAKCVNEKGTVRFVVMRRIHGKTLNQFRNNYSPQGVALFRGLSILGILVEFLQVLHSNQIVHGDIHGGNILLALDSSGQTTIQIIDYGLAFFDSEGIRSNNATHPLGHWTHELTTPWQIRGLPWGKRDDIYKAFDLCARLINADHWAEYVKGLVDAGTDRLLAFRDRDSFMDVPAELHAVSDSPFSADVLQVPLEVAESIRNRFANLVRRILELSDVNTEPPYAFILGELESIQRILKPEFFVDTNRS